MNTQAAARLSTHGTVRGHREPRGYLTVLVDGGVPGKPACRGGTTVTVGESVVRPHAGGIGKTRANALLAAGIAPTRRVRSLGTRQQQTLADAQHR